MNNSTKITLIVLMVIAFVVGVVFIIGLFTWIPDMLSSSESESEDETTEGFATSVASTASAVVGGCDINSDSTYSSSSFAQSNDFSNISEQIIGGGTGIKSFGDSVASLGNAISDLGTGLSSMSNKQMYNALRCVAGQAKTYAGAVAGMETDDLVGILASVVSASA